MKEGQPGVTPYITELESKVPDNYVFRDIDDTKVLSLLWGEARSELEAAKKQ